MTLDAQHFENVASNKKIYELMNVSEFKRMKSSLKFCVIASGEYDGYVAEPRACEWDIAAGHAILEHAGGVISDFEGNEILYGKKVKNLTIFVSPTNLFPRPMDLLFPERKSLELKTWTPFPRHIPQVLWISFLTAN